MCLCACVYICVCARVRVCVRADARVCVLCMHVRACTCVCMFAQVYMLVYLQYVPYSPKFCGTIFSRLSRENLLL